MSRRLTVAASWLLLGALSAAALAGCESFSNWLAGEPPNIREYRVANGLFDDKRYEEAAVAYRAWLADYHDKQDVLQPFVIYKLGECYRVMRDHEAAIAAYTTLIELHAGSPDEKVQDLVGLARLRLDDITPDPRPQPPDASGE